MTTKTIILAIDYSKSKIRVEKLCTLKEYIEFNRLKAGQKILIGDIDENGRTSNTESFWVGDVTYYPSSKDSKFSWNLLDPKMQKFVIEVSEYD